MSPRCAVIAALLSTLVGAGDLHAQRPPNVRMSSTPSCKNCRISVSLVARLGSEEGSRTTRGAGGSVVRNGHGQFLAFFRDLPSEISIFDSSGRFVRAAGRRGEGPGEYQRIQFLLVTPGDTLYAYDARLQRRSILAPPNYSFVRSTPTPASSWAVVRLPDGRHVINADVPTPERAGLPLHLLDADGNIVTSFGADPAVYRPDVTGLLLRAVALGGPTSVWSAARDEYLLELWDVATGRRLWQVTRDADWFRPHLEDPPLSPNRTPAPRIASIHQASDGLLWVAIRVPSPRWKDFIEHRPGPYNPPLYIPVDLDAVYDTVIEVIDPAAGRLIASQRVSQVLGAFLGDGLVRSLQEDKDGNPVTEIWRVQVNKQPAKE